jgi:putative transposase
MNRARRGDDIFAYRKDYLAFVDLLRESAHMWNVKVAAYCMIPNHYHLLVHTPDGNLSRFMRHIDGVYKDKGLRRRIEALRVGLENRQKWS